LPIDAIVPATRVSEATVMRHLADVISGHLRWAQPRVFDREWELRHGDEAVATLTFRSAFGSFATARSADGAWTFKRVGFWQSRATVRAEGAADDLAVFEHDTWSGGGTLTLAGGRPIRVTTNFWQSKIEFLAQDDDVLFRYSTEGFLRQESQLEVMPSLQRMREMPWLILFGWYLVVMMHQDAAGAVVVAG
jgi:hypothetical protein